MGLAGRLDHQWAVRWLDDIGLPQYKDAFLESRMDGRMLHSLTVDDLANQLKVTNLLHLICIRRGIQVLRLHHYNPACLQRRSAAPMIPADDSQAEEADGCSSVAVWTNHRVMEWLRAVDLSEYAPNMRGSGKRQSIRNDFHHFLNFVGNVGWIKASMADCWSTSRVSTPNCWQRCCRFRSRRRYCGATWPPISISWSAAMLSTSNAKWKHRPPTRR